jgi:hypothetical protein
MPKPAGNADGTQPTSMTATAPTVVRRRRSWLHLDAPGCRRTLSVLWRADAYLLAAARALTEFAVGYFQTWRGDA